jgi:hypothetical protein
MLAPFRTRPGSMELALKRLLVRPRRRPSMIINCLISLARDSRAPSQLSRPPSTYFFFLFFSSFSACTCPGEDQDHPGPSPSTGRGAPEIDIVEAEHNKQGSGAVVSQSAQFAPFTANYQYINDSDQDWKVYNPSISQPNSYKYVLHLKLRYIADIPLWRRLAGDLLCQLYPFLYYRIS